VPNPSPPNPPVSPARKGGVLEAFTSAGEGGAEAPRRRQIGRFSVTPSEHVFLSPNQTLTVSVRMGKDHPAVSSKPSGVSSAPLKSAPPVTAGSISPAREGGG
jgi:hypothetical protein